MRKAYFGDIGSQLHYRDLGQGEALVLLSPAPHSGLYFEKVMPFLATRHRVIAPDYPGYGGSDKLTVTPDIEAYAHRLKPFLASLGTVHLIGFHTGNLIAVELALSAPRWLGQLILIDVPYFDFKTRAEMRRKIKYPSDLPLSINDLSKSFEVNVSARIDDLGHERAYNIWVESLRPDGHQNAAFHAAFGYECEDKFKRLKSATELIATDSSLLEPTRRTAEVINQAALTECLNIKGSVFDKHAADIASEVLRMTGP